MARKVQPAPFFIRDLEALKTVADPLRVKIIGICSRKPSSVKEIGAKLQVPSVQLYYHVQLLESCGFLIVDSVRVLSGVKEKRYRSISGDIRVDRTVLGSRAPEKLLEGLLGAVIDGTRLEAEKSARAGVLAVGRPEDALTSGLFARLQIALSDEKALELRTRLDELVAEYRATGDDAAKPYNLAIAFFPTAGR